MSTPTKPKPDWMPEPFPEPRTIPEGWESTALQDYDKNRLPQETPFDDWKPEPFPEPRMLPWDSEK
jgi:hypothetical protein